MTLLSENLRAIRKYHQCTQKAMAQVLGIGFRSYVRYEAGERDAPPSALIQIAHLGSVSLDRLLTTHLNAKDLDFPDSKTPPEILKKPQIINGSLSAGRLSLKGLRADIYLCRNDKESEVLNKFRGLSPSEKEKTFQDGEWLIKNRNKLQKQSNPQSRKILKAERLNQLKEIVRPLQSKYLFK
ncbi:MAG: hypothetical protein COV66_03825 [Nitrospinae bacterium CG11_big_fil_rev_8_21_14_0_20_45_15]|nr:MAG: hypothetical protein COV66_03825 [Nitrospinae bacterium CG11_big_fil_rev_8_21_14_0_20_45_15]